MQSGDLTGALEKLLNIEKKTRLAGDSSSTSKIAVEIVRQCWETKNFEQLNAHILILAKRRAQLKQAIADMVKEAMTYIEQISDKDEKLALVSTLRTVTDGKIYVEVSLAMRQCTRTRCRTYGNVYVIADLVLTEKQGGQTGSFIGRRVNICERIDTAR